jgi:N-acetylmuramic acid 6-phosphate (MurNAc-6-P) etherase
MSTLMASLGKTLGDLLAAVQRAVKKMAKRGKSLIYRATCFVIETAKRYFGELSLILVAEVAKKFATRAVGV